LAVISRPICIGIGLGLVLKYMIVWFQSRSSVFCLILEVNETRPSLTTCKDQERYGLDIINAQQLVFRQYLKAISDNSGAEGAEQVPETYRCFAKASVFKCFVCASELNYCTACLIVRPNQVKMSNSRLESLTFLK